MAAHSDDGIASGDDATSRSDHGKSDPHSKIHLVEDSLEVSTDTYTEAENKSLVRKLDWHVSIKIQQMLDGKQAITEMTDIAFHLVVLPVQLVRQEQRFQR